MGLFDVIRGFFGSARGGSGFFTMPELEIGAGFYQSSVEVSQNIDSLKKALTDFTVPLGISIKEVIIPSIRENFRAEGRPHWQQLAARTVAIRGSSHPILYVSGNLYDAATSEDIWHVTNTAASVKNFPLAYGIYHTAGTLRMPARPFLTLPPEEYPKIVAVFEAWVGQQAEQRGRFRRR